MSSQQDTAWTAVRFEMFVGNRFYSVQFISHGYWLALVTVRPTKRGETYTNHTIGTFKSEADAKAACVGHSARASASLLQVV